MHLCVGKRTPPKTMGKKLRLEPSDLLLWLSKGRLSFCEYCNPSHDTKGKHHIAVDWLLLKSWGHWDRASGREIKRSYWLTTKTWTKSGDLGIRVQVRFHTSYKIKDAFLCQGGNLVDVIKDSVQWNHSPLPILVIPRPSFSKVSSMQYCLVFASVVAFPCYSPFLFHKISKLGTKPKKLWWVLKATPLPILSCNCSYSSCTTNKCFCLCNNFWSCAKGLK